MFQLLGTNKMLLHLPYYCFLGLSVTLFWGPVPAVITAKFGVKILPFVFVAYGAGQLIGAFTYGKIYDLKGWMPLAITNIFILTAEYILIPVGDYTDSEIPFFFAAFFHGQCEALVNALILCSMMELFPNQVSSASSSTYYSTTLYTRRLILVFRFFSAFGCGIGMVSSKWISYPVFEIMWYIEMFIGLGCLAYCHMKIIPLEKRLAEAKQNAGYD